MIVRLVTWSVLFVVVVILGWLAVVDAAIYEVERRQSDVAEREQRPQ
jgi:hypothetical protein